MDFQIGDRVVLTGIYAGESIDILPSGATGTVVYYANGQWPPIGVCWDVKPQNGHDCQGHCERGYGWFVCEDEIECIIDDAENAPDISSLL